MPAYVIVDVNITDPDRYEDYKKLAGPTVGQFDGRDLARGGATQVLEGNRTPGPSRHTRIPFGRPRTRMVELEGIRPGKEDPAGDSQYGDGAG